MPVFLWTDVLLLSLFGLVLILLFRTRNNTEDLLIWGKILRHPLHTMSLVVLIFFISIGLLDSIHYRIRIGTHDQQAVYSTNVVSLLDQLLHPIATQMESSYSPPFATELFNPRMIKQADGTIIWQNDQLTYVKPVQIFPKVMLGVGIGCLVWLLMSLMLWTVFKTKILHLKNWKLYLIPPWLMIGGIIITSSICLVLMQYYHILGTDKVGTDVFYASIKSIRTGLVIGTLTTMITLPFAIMFGALAGYLGGWVDDLIQYIYTTLSSIPAVLLIAASALTLDAFLERNVGMSLMAQRSDLRLLMLCCILGLTSWTGLCRIIRGEVLKLREQDFVLAAQVLGSKTSIVILKHILPNLWHIILISFVLDFSGLVLAEAVLTYVGVGVDPTMFSWGNMINSARLELGRDPIIWWSLTGAFILMFILVLAANIFADGVRAAFAVKED